MKSNRSGRRYDREFKSNAVALVRGGRTITEVGRDLGVSKWSLGHWVRRAEDGQMLSEPKTLALETPYDQPGVAARIAHKKTGVVTSLAELTADHLAGLLREVLNEPSYRANARKLQKAIAEANGLSVAAT